VALLVTKRNQNRNMDIQLIITILLIVVTLYLYNKLQREQYRSKSLAASYDKVLSQKKSSEVVTGQIAEKLVPFLKNFNHNPRDATFCGSPIDYVIFGPDQITILEIKTGNSRLTKKQRHIKSLVQNGDVVWEEIRIK